MIPRKNGSTGLMIGLESTALLKQTIIVKEIFLIIFSLHRHLNSMDTFATSIPVNDFTSSGSLVMISTTSPVSLAAPVSPFDVTMVIFFVWVNGADTSAAIFKY